MNSGLVLSSTLPVSSTPGHEREDPGHTVPGPGDHGVLEVDGGPLDPDEDLALREVGVGQLDHCGSDDRARLGEQVGREAHGLTVEARCRRLPVRRRRNGYVRTVTTIAGYGGWASPLAAGDVARAKVSLSELCSDGDAVYWLESRPAEAGRTVVVRADGRGMADHSPEGVSIRSRVNEYGGGALCLVPGRSAGRLRLRGPGGPAGVVLRRRRRPRAGPGGAGGAERDASGGRGAQPRRAERHGGRRMGAWPSGRIHREGSAGPGAPRRRAARRRAESPVRDHAARGHDFFGTPRAHPTATAWPWSPGTTPTCRGTPRACWCRRSAELPARCTGTRRCGRRDRRSTSPAAPRRSVGQPAWDRDGRVALRLGSARLVAALRPPGGPGRRRSPRR